MTDAELCTLVRDLADRLLERRDRVDIGCVAPVHGAGCVEVEFRRGSAIRTRRYSTEGVSPLVDPGGMLGLECALRRRSTGHRRAAQHRSQGGAGRSRADPTALNSSSRPPLNPGQKPARMLAHSLEAEAGDDRVPGRLTP